MKQELQTIAIQIDWRELNMAKFKLSFSDVDNQIQIRKGNKCLQIQYDSGNDLYNLTEYILGKFTIESEKRFNGIYADSLKEFIQDFFKFEYVMDKLLRNRN